MLRALALTFGFVLIAFGAFFAGLAFRQREREPHVLPWGLATGALYVAVGATVVVGLLMPGAVRYAAGAVAVLLLVRLAARRRLVRSSA